MILIRPIITEKTKALSEKYNQYTFEVGRDSDKNNVKGEVEKLYGVTVTDIKTMNQKGEIKRQLRNRKSYFKSGFKKAVVTLKKGDKIDAFEKKKK